MCVCVCVFVCVYIYLILLFETYSSVFSFCLIFFLFVTMKLGETVTYLGLEGMSLCGNVPLQSVSAQWFWWESWI